MARFYASIQGSRGEATRMGTASSGITGHVRGWNIGGEVQMSSRMGEESDADTCVMTLTGGSSGQRNLGVEIAAFEATGIGTRYVVRLPGNVEVRGYVGDARFEMFRDGRKIYEGVEKV